MKWNTIVGTIVLSLGLCSQSFGFDLLNRMLGSSGCGCDNGAKNCCAPGPSCCVKKPDCGPKCCVKKCEPILSRFCLKKCCNDCSKCCDKGCADKGCAAPAPTCAAPAPACGCDGGKAPVKAEGEATPPPPAPVVDPSAYIQSTQRRVVQASATLVR